MNAPLDPRENHARPTWERWQSIRTPETIPEALAAIDLTNLKVAALEAAAADHPNPLRAADFRATALRWRDQGVGLAWALEVLRAGENPFRAKHTALQQRLHHLAELTTRCPDAASLVAHLLRQLELVAAHRDRLAMEVMGLEHIVTERNAEVADLSRQLRAVQEVRRG